MAKNTLLIILIWIYFYPVCAQIKSQGTPFIKNYTSTDYKFHPKNFSVIQDNRGMMYFANAYGILEYDGVSWRTINLPNGKSAISFAKDSLGKIYVGSVGEFGFLDRDSLGHTIYKSLLATIQEGDKNFGEVWNVLIDDSYILFVSYLKLVALHNGKVTIYSPAQGMAFDFSTKANDEIFIRESGRGLLHFSNGELVLENNGEYFSHKIIHAMEAEGQDHYQIMAEDGLTKYDGTNFKISPSPAASFIHKNQLSGILSLSDHAIAIHTSNAGILFTDANGNPIQHLTKKNGLPSDNIYDLYCDDERNLWAVTDNGISYIQISTPFTSLGENDKLEGMGYASFIHDHKLYLGTSRGLYFKKWNPAQNPLDPSCNFQLVENTEGQIWCINEIDGTLLSGDNHGLMQIENGKIIRLSPL
jgi:ligand-binding sensor domain-containing protein